MRIKQNLVPYVYFDWCYCAINFYIFTWLKWTLYFSWHHNAKSLCYLRWTYSWRFAFLAFYLFTINFGKAKHTHTHTCVKKWLVKYRHACTVIVIVFDYANKPNRLGDRFKKRPFPKCETYHIRQIYKLVWSYAEQS